MAVHGIRGRTFRWRSAWQAACLAGLLLGTSPQGAHAHDAVPAVLGLAAVPAPEAPLAVPPQREALLRELMHWASRLTRIPAPPTLPAVLAISPEALSRKVCPEQPGHCRTLVAVYDTDTRRIFHRDTLDLDDVAHQSFIVHELVHYLQHQRDGERLFADCRSIIAAEAEAYRAQNRFLAAFDQWQRAGEMLRFAHCPDPAGEPEIRPRAAPALAAQSH